MNINDPKRKGQWRVFGLLLAIALVLFILDNTGTLGNGFNFLRDPLAGFTQNFSGLTALLRRPADLQTAQYEIENLNARLVQLERENEQLREIQNEYQQLLELLNRANETPNLTRVTAAVVGRGSNPSFRDLIIDQGSNDGVRVGMPVESARGMVGQIYRTTADASQVLLITDSQSHVPGRLSRSRATGIISGGGTGGLMVLDWVDLEAQVLLNENVFTSGLSWSPPAGVGNAVEIGNRFPGDIVLGRVIEINRGQAELFQQAIIQPSVDFDTLETVFVITNFEPVNQGIFTPEGAP